MRVIDVLPLSRGVFRESLSYFTGNDTVVPGTIVSIPLRSKIIHALVISVRSPVELKTDLKSSSFSLKKINTVKSKELFLPEFIRAAEDTAIYTASTTGAVLSHFISKALLEYSHSTVHKHDLKKTTGRLVRETYAIQTGDEERFAEYKSLIRERFARGFSVFLCLPTSHEVESLTTLLDRGIKDYSFILHTGLSKNKLISTWKAALVEPHPVLIIGTSPFISIPRRDIGTIIIERESSRFYKAHTRPYPDTRVFAAFYAKRRGIELVLGDIALRVETLFKVENGEYAEFGSSLKNRSLWSGAYRIVDMRAPLHPAETTSKKVFTILSPELQKIISELSQNNERLFIFTARRGLSPLTVCGDCGTVVNCSRCSAPITLHRRGSATFFFCHHCGLKKETDTNCRVCNSWKLETLGIGIELVEKIIKTTFPNVSLFRLDKDSAGSLQKATIIAKHFYEKTGSVLLGTESALQYLSEKVENSAVVSIDSLFSIPDFRMNERIFSMLLLIRAKTAKRFLIQTRNIEASVLAHAALGMIGDFYKEEIEIRDVFQYPPFTTLIKISFEGRRDEVKKNTEFLKLFLKSFSVEVFPAFISEVRGKYIMHALLRVKRLEWPHGALLLLLKELPPSFKIEIDPETIL